jgi:hypothetical protein
MHVRLFLHRLRCQPVDTWERWARRRRRWRLLILILVATVVATLTMHGYTMVAALSAIVGVVQVSRVVAWYLLGVPSPKAVKV